MLLLCRQITSSLIGAVMFIQFEEFVFHLSIGDSYLLFLLKIFIRRKEGVEELLSYKNLEFSQKIATKT